MNAFSAATAVLFQDPNLSVAAEYFAEGIGAGQPVRIIRRRPDEVANFGASRSAVPTQVIDARVADLPRVTRGDTFRINAEDWKVSAAPLRDREHLTWRIELVPVT